MCDPYLRRQPRVNRAIGQSRLRDWRIATPREAVIWPPTEASGPPASLLGQALEQLALALVALLEPLHERLVLPARLDVLVDRRADGVGQGLVLGTSHQLQGGSALVVEAKRHRLHLGSLVGMTTILTPLRQDCKEA